MKHTRPDGFYGSMLASESIIDGMTILHGPGGCRGLAASYSSRFVPREFVTIEGDFFFHRSRIPCTFVDADDYIYGASKKVGMILDILRSKDTKFAVVLESPGASLIGDKLQDEVIGSEMSEKTVIVGKCLMSETFGHGYDKTLCMIAKKLTVKREKKNNKVNIVGLPYLAKGCFPLLKELHGLLGSMGLEVIADIGSACTIEQMKESSEAAANVCICPEYFAETGRYYEESLGVPLVRGPVGAPIGYDAIRAWVSEIAKVTGCDPSPALRIVDEEDCDVKRCVDTTLGVGEIANFLSFSVMAEPSIALPLTHFLMKRTRIAPVIIELTEKDEIYEGQLKEILERTGTSDSLGREFGSEYTEIVFGPGGMCEYLRQKGLCNTIFDISIPSKDYLDIAPKSIIGLDGCRRIVEGVLNTR